MKLKYSLSALALLTLGSCMKAPSTDVEKGQEADCGQIDQFVNEARTQSIVSIKKGEYSNTDSTFKVETLNPETTAQYAVTIMDRTDTAKAITLRIREDAREMVDGQFKNSSKEDTYTILKGNGTDVASVGTSSTTPEADPSVHDANSMALLKSQSLMPTLRVRSTASVQAVGALCQKKAEGEVTSYNNLEVRNIEIPIPTAVKRKANCGGLANCTDTLTAKLLKFDRWMKDYQGKELKVTSYMMTSPDVPYFAGILSQCFQYSQPYENRQILVTECEDVTDFTFGTDSL